MAKRLGPAQPRAVTWKGAGGWVTVWQSRQLNRSRTVAITFHWRGTTSSVSVTSSPSLESRPPPRAKGRRLGRRSPPALAAGARGRADARGAPAGEGLDRRGLGGRHLSLQLVEGGGRFQLLQLQLVLVEQAL